MPTTRPGRLVGSVDSFQASIHGFGQRSWFSMR
jgi:hypothetical protein